MAAASNQNYSDSNTIGCAVLGASGYSGAELVRLVQQNPHFELVAAYCSAASEAQSFHQLYPQHAISKDITLQPWSDAEVGQLAGKIQVVFLALPHEASASIAPLLIEHGLVVFDLSGAFRLHDAQLHKTHYQFDQVTTPQPVPYGLSEWCELIGQEPLVAVPGCYPTVSALALKPLLPVLTDAVPYIHAVSGVSGAGRKASLTTHVCEVSLQAYGVGTHRHQPEIAQTLGRDVVFTPHLGHFPRGILATIYVSVQKGTSQADIDAIYQAAYAEQPLVRLPGKAPAIHHVAHTPFCDIYAKLVSPQQLVICAAIDNLQKGAAAQAMQLANRYFNKPQTAGLLVSVSAAEGSK